MCQGQTLCFISFFIWSRTCSLMSFFRISGGFICVRKYCKVTFVKILLLQESVSGESSCIALLDYLANGLKIYRNITVSVPKTMFITYHLRVFPSLHLFSDKIDAVLCIYLFFFVKAVQRMSGNVSVLSLLQKYTHIWSLLMFNCMLVRFNVIFNPFQVCMVDVCSIFEQFYCCRLQ